MTTLQELRNRLSVLDEALIRTLAERSHLVRSIGQVKRQLQLPVLDIDREREVAELWGKWAETHGVSKTFVQDICTLVIAESKHIQENV